MNRKEDYYHNYVVTLLNNGIKYQDAIEAGYQLVKAHENIDKVVNPPKQKGESIFTKIRNRLPTVVFTDQDTKTQIN